MPHFTLRTVSTNSYGNPGIRYFYEDDSKSLLNHVVIYELTLEFREDHLHTLLNNLVVNSSANIDIHYNQETHITYNKHVGKEKLCLNKNYATGHLHLPKLINNNYTLKSIGVAIDTTKIHDGKHGNIAIIYNDGNYTPAGTTPVNYVNEIVFNIHIKLANVNNTFKNIEKALQMAVYTFNSQIQNRNSEMAKAIIFSSSNNNVLTKLNPRDYTVSKGQQEFIIFAEHNGISNQTVTQLVNFKSPKPKPASKFKFSY